MNNLAKTLGQFLGKSTLSSDVPALGDRELELMKIFWEGEPMSAKQVLQSIPDQSLSLSTMQTTLERLHRKKLLSREKKGRFFVYEATVSRSQIIELLLGDITEQICDGDVATLVSGFTSFCSTSDTKGAETLANNENLPTANISDDEPSR